MNAIVSTTSLLTVRADVSVRAATMADLPFMDGLQKAHSKQLGYFPTQQFQSYIEGGNVLIAESLLEVGGLKLDGTTSNPQTSNPQTTPTRVGYCIAKDRYLKRDELGVIYQLCVAPGVQRKQVGAALVKAAFERSAYGCKLYCCWCAQDITANYFWQSMGFLPVAFRAGSTGNGRRRQARVHIFWQRRINATDTSTPYWYPCMTNSGAIRADRLVFPIPPGTHWKDVHAVAMPAASPPMLAWAAGSVTPGFNRPIPVSVRERRPFKSLFANEIGE